VELLIFAQSYMKILFVVPYPLGRSPSQRFRFEQYFRVLSNAGGHYTVKSFYDDAGWSSLYSRGNGLKKLYFVVRGLLIRTALLFRLNPYQFIFIHREAAPVGPPFFEWAAAKIWGKKIIYDFDDAIWTTDNLFESPWAKMIRWRSKTAFICKIASVVSCGNEYLATYAKRFNSSVVINPTTIDTTYHLPARKISGNKTVIGWTGSHSTLKYLDKVIPAIAKLERVFPDLVFRVIADADPQFQLASFQFIRFTEEHEIDDLSAFDIGIMPLPDDEWAKGKCGFKALQYMALDIPAAASPVGVNTSIIKDGTNGFLCATTDDWIAKLTALINDLSLRKQIGKAGRKTVEENYSVNSNSSNFLCLFDLSAINTKASR
jgi:glycosyltransferase involved in cell wall biosynthesis